MSKRVVDDDQWSELLAEHEEPKDDPATDWSIPAYKRKEMADRDDEGFVPPGSKYDATDPANAETWEPDGFLDEGWAIGSMRHHLGSDPFELIQDLRELGHLKAEAECDLDALEDRLPRIKAEASAAARQKKGVTTEAHVRELRDRSDRIKEHLSEMDTCRRRVRRYEAQYWALKEEISMTQSAIYLLQSELKTLRS